MKKYLVIALIVIGSLLSIGATYRVCNIAHSANGKYFVVTWKEVTVVNGRYIPRLWTQNVYPSDPHVFDLVLQCYHPQ